MNGRAPRKGLDLVEQASAVEASLWRRLRFEQESSCRHALFNRYLALARAIANGEYSRRPPYGLERADFQQLAVSGLLEAIDQYDPLHGAPFAAFARRRIRGAIADGAAKSSEAGTQYSQRRRIELDRLRSLGATSIDESADYLSQLAELSANLAIGLIAESASLVGSPTDKAHHTHSPYAGASWRELQLSVAREIENLPAAERSIMELHYFNGVPFVQIAQALGVGKSRVSQLHRSAIARVRARMRRLD
jgi:RNA polymerase sigma factor for flagellar operon FliA